MRSILIEDTKHGYDLPLLSTLRWLVSVVLLLWLAGPYWPWTVDDVYITEGFARMWSERGELVWRDGSRVEGYSNFLLVALLALGMHVGGEGAVLAQQIALASSIALLGVAHHYLPRNTLGTMSLVGLAVWNPLCRWSVVGMETTLYALLLASGWALTIQRAPQRWAAGVLLLALASLTRPEGAAFVLLALLLRARLPRKPLRADLAVIAVVAALAGYHAVRIAWFGHILPTPALVKIVGRPWMWRGVVQGLVELSTSVGFVAAALLAVRPRRAALMMASVPLLVHVAVLVRAGGDWMGFARILLPGVIASLIALGVESRAQGGQIRRRWMWGLVAGGIVWGAAVEAPQWQTQPLVLRSAWGLDRPVAMYKIGLDTPLREDLAWMIENVPPAAVVYLSDVGMLSQIPDVRVLDMAGLVTQDIANRYADDNVLGWIVSSMDKIQRQTFFMRVANQSSSWVSMPDELSERIYKYEMVRTGSVYSQWFVSNTDIEKPSPDEQRRRWDFIIQKLPYQPELRWMFAMNRARNDDVHFAGKILEAGRERWPEDGRFTSGTDAVSFVDGDLAVSFDPDRGFSMYSNGTLNSRPLHPDREDIYLNVDCDCPGQGGASLRVNFVPNCAPPIERAVFGRESFHISPAACADEPFIRLSVSFLNDKYNSQGCDRNLYIKISTLELP